MKIAIIGAGSMVFSKNVISDILFFDELKHVNFSLMDTDPERLAVAEALARSINATRGAGAGIKATTNRKAALAGADVVINTIGVGGFEATRKDLEIPMRHGLRQTIGDTLGIGGIFRTLRSLPVVLDLCRDMEEVCPQALLLNYVNPMATHCMGIARATKIRTVGLCHGVRYTRGRVIMLARLAEMSAKERSALMKGWDPTETGVPQLGDFYHQCVMDEKVETLCAGINHMAAILTLRENGKDLYPLVRKAAGFKPLWDLEPVRLDLFQRLGYFLTETSGHMAEYLPWYMKSDSEIKRCSPMLRPLIYLKTCDDLAAVFKEYKRKAKASEPFIGTDEPVSAEYASRIILAAATNRPYLFNGNVPNYGGALISNLPGDACVEVPCAVDGTGVHPTRVGDLPPQLAALMRTNINVQDLTVRAILEEKKDHLYHAAMLDPNTSASLTLPQIWKLMDEMIVAHGSGLPRFAR